MSALREKYLRLSADSQRAFWVMTVLALFMLVASVNFIPELLVAKNFTNILANSIPLILALVSVICAVLSWNDKNIASGVLLISTLLVILLVLPMLAEGYGTIAGVTSFLLPSIIALMVLPGSFFGWVTFAGAVFSTGVRLVDGFWPFARIGQDTNDINATMVIAGILVIVYVVVVIRRFRNLSLTTKLVLAFILITYSPQQVVTQINNATYSRDLTKSANNALLSSAEQTADVVDTFIRTNLDNIRTNAQLTPLATYLQLSPSERAQENIQAEVFGILTALGRQDPINITSYALYDLGGKNILDTNSENINSDASNQAFFKQPLADGLPFISPVLFDQETNTQALIFSAPILSGSGEYLGVLRASYEPGILQQLIYQTSSNLPENTSLLLMDENGTILANNYDPEIIFSSILPADSSRLSELQRNQRLPAKSIDQLSSNLPTLVSGLDNLDQQPFFPVEIHSDEAHRELASGTRLEENGWSVVVSQPEDILLAPVSLQTRNAQIIGDIMLALVVLLAMGASSILSKPLLYLAEIANRVAQGDLTLQARAENQDEIGLLSKAFNSMTSQLRSFIGTLEQRVADRTKALATSTEVSRRLSTILDQAQLVREVVDQLQSAFGYYHAHIYLFDTGKQALLMAGGTGEAGRTLLARGHKIEPGRGLVGRAAASNSPVLVPDVALEPGWLPNPLLPETRAEVAVPIAIGNEVIGVLDVQHNITGGLEQQDADLLQSIASQVAIALRNAQAYTAAQSQAQREALVASISQRIQTATNIDDILKVAVSELGRALGANQASVELRANQPAVPGKN